MKLSCISGFANLFHQLLHGTACKSWPIKLFLDFWHGAVVQKLPCETISEAFAWSCPAKVALQSYFSSFCMELSCRSCLCEALPQAFVWKCRAKVAFWNYFFSFCMDLSCKRCLVWNIVEYYFQAPVTCFWIMADISPTLERPASRATALQPKNDKAKGLGRNGLCLGRCRPSCTWAPCPASGLQCQAHDLSWFRFGLLWLSCRGEARVLISARAWFSVSTKLHSEWLLMSAGNAMISVA